MVCRPFRHGWSGTCMHVSTYLDLICLFTWHISPQHKHCWLRSNGLHDRRNFITEEVYCADVRVAKVVLVNNR